MSRKITEEAESQDSTGRSELASSIDRLARATVEAAEKRERLPQPLFWSLFHAELNQLKRKKREKRALDQIFKAFD